MVSYEYAIKTFNYDPFTGLLSNKVFRSNRSQKGYVYNHEDAHGYIITGINNTPRFVHRIAWLIMEGYWPEHEIDHKNGIRSDNRWCNLRHVTRTCNKQNSKVFSTNKSGFPGVSFNKSKNKWQVNVWMNNKITYLGRFDTALEGALARLTWELQCPYWTCNLRGELIKKIRKEGVKLNL